MLGGVRAGAPRDVDHRDELCVGLGEDFVSSYRTEGRETGSDCMEMVSRTQKILIQLQIGRQGNHMALSMSVVVLIPRERTSHFSKVSIFL